MCFRFCLLALIAALELFSTVFAQDALKIFVNNQQVTNSIALYGTAGRVTMTGYTGGHIFYTTNGTAPTIASAEYNGALNFATSFELRAIAYDAGFTQSSAGSITVTIAPLYTLRLAGATKYMEYSIDGSPYQAPTGFILNVGSNQLVSLRAVPADDWLFDAWKGRHHSTEQTNSFRMDRSEAIYLSMIRTTPIDVPVNGDGEVMVEPPPYHFGDDVQITAVPHAGNFFAGWNLPQATPEAISFYQRADATPPTAYFSPLLEGTYSLSVQIDGHGTVVEPTRYFTAADASVKVTVQPPEGWYVTGWSGDASGPGTNQLNPRGNSITLTMDTNKTVVAHLTNLVTWSVKDVAGLALFAQSVAPNGYIIYRAQVFDGADETQYFVGYDREGIEQWETVTPSRKGLAISGMAIGPDGTIFESLDTLGGPGLVKAYSSQDGSLLWQINAPGANVAMAAGEQGLYVCSPVTGRALRHYDLAGNLIRELPSASAAFNDWWYVILDPDSNAVTTGQNIGDYTPTLDLRWTKPNPTYPGGNRPQGIVSDANGNIITGDLRAFSATNGATLWTTPYTGGSLICVGTNRVYIRENTNGALSALDLATGHKVWTLEEPYGAGVGVTGVVAADDGGLFAVFNSFILRKITAAGTILWEVANGGGWPLLTPEGKLYLGLNGYEVGVGPAKSGFPMPRGDWMNSGSAYIGSVPILNELALEQSGDSFRIQFTPGTSAQLTLQSSEDLVNWTDEKKFSGPLDYIVPASEGHRFFRVILE